MGERSQIYVRYKNSFKKGLIANAYDFNYGERMISRAKWGIGYILSRIYNMGILYIGDNIAIQMNDDQEDREISFCDEDELKLRRFFDVNFDMHDVAISGDIIKTKENNLTEQNFRRLIFEDVANDDGKLLIDVCGKTVKYAFLDGECNTDHIMDGEAYMCWNTGENWRKSKYLSEETVKTCEDNIDFISELGELMTKEEVEEFLNYNYLKDNFLFQIPYWRDNNHSDCCDSEEDNPFPDDVELW